MYAWNEQSGDRLIQVQINEFIKFPVIFDLEEFKNQSYVIINRMADVLKTLLRRSMFVTSLGAMRK